MGSEKLNLCFVSREYPPAPYGGIGTYLINTAQLLADEGHIVHIVTEWVPGTHREEVNGNIYIHRLPFRDHSASYMGLHPDVENRPGCHELYFTRDPMNAFALVVSDYLFALLKKTKIDIIESPEFESPLYYFQTFRLLCKDFPSIPCVVQLHSSTRDCNFYNHEDLYSRPLIHREHTEIFTIAMADALLSPSLFLARAIEERFGLQKNTVRVIHLPLGKIPNIQMKKSRAQNRILYTGRLERRKGVDVLVKAGLLLAEDFPDLRIRCIGSDWWYPPRGKSWRESIEKNLSERGTGIFEFIPHKQREQLWEEYLTATICCVPSLWENFPNTCMEAMACGAPVVASRNGGMAEMIIDGKSGMLCDADDPIALAAALRRVLQMAPEERDVMGREAAKRIRTLCDNETIAREHIEFYREVISQQSRRELRVPSFCPSPHITLQAEHPKRSEALRSMPHKRKGTVSIVIPCYNLGVYLNGCVQSVLNQTVAPQEIVIVDDGSTDPETQESLHQWEGRRGVKVVHMANGGLPYARNEGFRHTTGDYLVFLDADDMMKPTYLEKAAYAMDRHAEIGVLSPWAENFGEMSGVWTPPHGQFPFLLVENTIATGAMVRRVAYKEAAGFKRCMLYGYEDWELWLTIAEKGWAVMALPEPLIRYRIRKHSMLQSINAASHGFLRRTMVELHQELFTKYGADVSLIIEQGHKGWSQDYTMLQNEVVELRKRLDRLRSLPTHPIGAFKFAVEKMALRIQRRLGKKQKT